MKQEKLLAFNISQAVGGYPPQNRKLELQNMYHLCIESEQRVREYIVDEAEHARLIEMLHSLDEKAAEDKKRQRLMRRLIYRERLLWALTGFFTALTILVIIVRSSNF